MKILTALLLSILVCTAAWAQNTAQISGTVKDQTGAVLPGADVTMTQTETGLKRTAVTDETGSYVLSSLPVGPYRLEAALPGFKTYAQTGIILEVNANPTINAILQVGQVADQVEVQAERADDEQQEQRQHQVSAPPHIAEAFAQLALRPLDVRGRV